MARALLGVIVAGLILTGCGSAGTGSAPTPGATPSVSPSGPHFDVVVSEKDTAAKIRVGQKLELVLHSSPNMGDWSRPRSSDETVLAPIVNPAGTAAVGVTLAAFQGLAPGLADITAIASPRCSPGQACPMYVQLYSLKVEVAA
jgi:hypothetical protein